MTANSQNIFDRLSAKNKENNFILPSSSSSEEQKIDPQEATGNIFEKFAQKKKELDESKFGLFDTLRDIAEQSVTKGLSGLTGAYGNILDAFGGQIKQNEIPPGNPEKYQIQSAILEKMNRGEAPSFGELMLLSDEDVLPIIPRLPTSKESQEKIKEITGIGEGKTPYGRIAGRGAEFIGEGLATGGSTAKALLSLGGAGLAGQALRESGAPEALASSVEIAGSLAPSVISKKLIPSGKEAKKFVQAGREIGLSESQITPLIQSEKKVATLSKIARKGSKTKKLFGEIKEKLGDSYNSIKGSKEAKIKLPNSSQIKLRKEFGEIRNELSKTLAPSPDKEAAINYIEKALSNLRETDITPEHLVNFWQDVNGVINWNSIGGGKKAITQLKNPISEVLKNVSPSLSKDFEMTNELYSKYAQISRKLKPEIVDAFLNKAEILAAPAAGVALATGNLGLLIPLVGEPASRIIGREMLINPYFQNIAKKLVVNFNQSSVKGVTESVKQVQEYLNRKHPNENWSFLTEDKSYEESD